MCACVRASVRVCTYVYWIGGGWALFAIRRRREDRTGRLKKEFPGETWK